MSFKLKENYQYELKMVAGDSEYVRLTLKDSDGEVIDISADVSAVMGIKRKYEDTEFLIPEIVGTTYAYDKYDQPYTLEFELTSDDTMALLNYDGKSRNKLTCVYDIEIENTHLGAYETTTIMAGPLYIHVSIGGKVR